MDTRERLPGAGGLVWADEFTGPAGRLPDQGTWTAERGGGGWGDGQLQHYTDSADNASIDGHGRLAITARRTPDGTVTSARLVTKERLSIRYGRIEASIKVPSGVGTWPAFWMLGTDIDDVGWPACGEIDVMEHVGSNPSTVHGTLHGPGYAGLAGGVGHAYDAGVHLAADFHVYGVDWAPDRVSWLLDGVAYASSGRDDVPGGWPFAHDFYVLLNLAVGGDWPGNHVDDPAALGLPATMLVDWIRVHDGTVRGTAAQR